MSDEIIRVSQELDKLIVQGMKNKSPENYRLIEEKREELYKK